MKQIAFSILLMLTLTSCSNMTKENYSKIQTGMSYEEVTDILGEADNCTSKLGVSSCIWGDKEKFISIQFIADKASFFSNKNIH